MSTKRTRRVARGFSLLELTLVLAIIGVLMAVAAVNVLGAGQRANIRATEATLRTVGSQIEAYALENAQTYPDSVVTLITAKYVDDGSQLDAWKQELYYRPVATTDGNPFILLSGGKDKTIGTEDDISYWTIKTKR